MLTLIIAILLIIGAISFFYFSYNEGETITYDWLGQTGELPLAWMPYLIVYLILGLLAIWLILKLFSLPSRISRSSKAKGVRQSRESLDRGLLEIQKGEFQKGESALTSHVDGTKGDAVKFIAAAKAAHQRGAGDQAEHYLKKASDASNDAGDAIRVAQAEMLLDRGSFADAETLLTSLSSKMPKNGHILGLLATALKGTGNNAKLVDVAGAMRSRAGVPDSIVAPIEHSARIALLKDSEPDQLTKHWESLPIEAKRDQAIAGQYAASLIDNNEHDKADTVLQKTLNAGWNDDLALLYSKVEASNSTKQLEVAEGWASKQPHNQAAALMVGALAAKRQLWGKSRESLVKAAENGELTTGLCNQLGHVLEAMGDSSKAQDCFKSAAALSLGEPAVGVLSDITNLSKNLA